MTWRADSFKENISPGGFLSHQLWAEPMQNVMFVCFLIILLAFWGYLASIFLPLAKLSNVIQLTCSGRRETYLDPVLVVKITLSKCNFYDTDFLKNHAMVNIATDHYCNTQYGKSTPWAKVGLSDDKGGRLMIRFRSRSNFLSRWGTSEGVGSQAVPGYWSRLWSSTVCQIPPLQSYWFSFCSRGVCETSLLCK